MNQSRNMIFTLAISVLFLSQSCEKPEGEGGNATIKGMVWMEDWNSTYTEKMAEYPAADAEVYIVYGNQTGVGDRIRADYNGQYEFRYLRKGNYKIYVYSKDNTLQSSSGEMAVVKEVKITSDKQTLEVNRITVYK